jgi:hypothetical protein
VGLRAQAVVHFTFDFASLPIARSVFSICPYTVFPLVNDLNQLATHPTNSPPCSFDLSFFPISFMLFFVFILISLFLPHKPSAPPDFPLSLFPTSRFPFRSTPGSPSSCLPALCISGRSPFFFSLPLTLALYQPLPPWTALSFPSCSFLL